MKNAFYIQSAAAFICALFMCMCGCVFVNSVECVCVHKHVCMLLQIPVHSHNLTVVYNAQHMQVAEGLNIMSASGVFAPSGRRDSTTRAGCVYPTIIHGI